MTKRAEDLRRDAVLAADVFAHHADQRLSPLVLYIGKLAQVCGNLRQALV